MPNIAGKKFPYTKEGMMNAAQAKKKMMGMKKGGMVKKNYMHGGEIKGTPPIQVSGKMFKGIF